MSALRALKHRPFALLWGGQTISRIGDHLYQVTLAWWVLEQTGSATAMGTILIVAFTPMLLFLLLGGVAVDRLPRVPLMLGSDLMRALINGVVAGLALGGTLEIWHLYVSSLLFGIVDAVFQPAYTALVPELVQSEDLPSANALTSFSTQGGRVLGPVIAAAIIAASGTSLAFAIDAGSFILSALFLLPLLWRPRPVTAPRPTERSSVLRDLLTGIGTVLASPWISISILVFAVTNVTLVGPYTVAIPYLVQEVRQESVGTLGLLYAAFPIGYVLGGIWLGRQRRIRRRGQLAYGGAIVAGLGMLVLGLPLPLWALLLAALLNGAALEIAGQIWINTLQEMVPGEQLGRVSSIDMLGSFALLPIGFALAGWATDALGAATVCVAGGALTMGLTALGLLHPAVRGLD